MPYQFFSQIDILASAVGEDEQNIPIALVLTDGRFATTGNGGHVENTDAGGGASGALTVPADLVVGPNEDGSSEYDFEFVDYNVATGYMEFWVEIVALSSSVDTPVIFAYGDPGVTTSQEDVTGVWDANYKGVWHLGEASATTTITDSTSNGYDLTKESASHPIQGAGQIGCGQDFDGAQDYAKRAAATINDSQGTIELWLKTAMDPADNPRLVQSADEAGNVYAFGVGLRAVTGAPFVAWITGGSWIICEGDTDLTDNALHRVVWISSGTAFTIYVDDAAAETLSGTNDGTWFGDVANRDNLVVGAQIRQAGVDALFDDIIDEVFISDIARGTDYKTTSYNNQKSPAPSGTFWSALGSEELWGQPMRQRLGRGTIMAVPMRGVY